MASTTNPTSPSWVVSSDTADQRLLIVRGAAVHLSRVRRQCPLASAPRQYALFDLRSCEPIQLLVAGQVSRIGFKLDM